MEKLILAVEENYTAGMLYHLAEKKSKLKIKSLKLKNFRNYELLNLEFDGAPTFSTGIMPRERRIF